MKFHVRVVSANKYASKVYEVDFVEEGYKVLMSEFSEVASKTGKKFYIFICDDRTTGYLYERYEELKDKFYFNHAGELDVSLSTWISTRFCSWQKSMR